ncbi:MAG: Kef-type K+ transport system membrane component KefB [Candidatus Marinamargulisbacteria bacterium]
MLLILGLFSGTLFKKLGLPKITGYLVSGFLIINLAEPYLPKNYLQTSEILVILGLAFISFEVGGQLAKERFLGLGKTIAWITFFTMLFPFVVVGIGFSLLLSLIYGSSSIEIMTVCIPASLLLAALSAPTDPTPLLVISHEKKVSGPVTSSIFGITAIDDLIAVLLFIFVFLISKILASPAEGFSLLTISDTLFWLFLSVSLGLLIGLSIKFACAFLVKQTDGLLIILLFGTLSFIAGLSGFFEIDVIATSMTMGIFIRNFSPNEHRLFDLLERYSDEMITLLFFTLSGLHLKMAFIKPLIPLIIVFVILRGLGKYLGVLAGAKISDAPESIKKYLTPGLIPQGGIVIGLALLVLKTPEMEPFSDLVFNIVIGATFIHGLAGPLLTIFTLRRAGEIPQNPTAL